MKRSLSDLAIFGGPKAFSEPMRFGQMNIPEWNRIEEIFSGIFDRHYFSNHGVLAQELEDKLCDYLNVRNAVTLSNGTIALMHTSIALGLTGKVVVPALTHPATVQALYWSGVQPLFCDVDPQTYVITSELVKPLIDKHDVSAILAVHLWGNICDTIGLEAVSRKYSVPVFYDAAHTFGCKKCGTMMGSSGTAEIFSFKADHVLNAAEGGLVCTNDDDLAATVRNLRSSYGRRKVVPIPVNANGRFSEFQAGLALLSFDDHERNCARNRACLSKYVDALQGIDGVTVNMPEVPREHNCQHVVLLINEQRFGLNRDTLFQMLVAENVLLKKYFSLGMHMRLPSKTHLSLNRDLPVTERVAASVLLAPSGQMITEEDIECICKIISYAHKNAEEIKKRLGSQ